MATINLGAIKFNWQGAYAGGTAYAVDDVVSYNGSSYICKLASTGNLPTNTTYWDQMSAKGTDGTNGTDLTSTLTTQGDILYRNASGLVRLPAGTNGQALITGGAGANPSWGSVASKVYDVYYNESTAEQTISSGTYTWVDVNGLSRTITPQSASSKFWIHGRVSTSSDGNHQYVALNCGGSLVHLSDSAGSRFRTTSSHSAKETWDMSDQTFAYLWEPATTSPVTIKIQATYEGASLVVNRGYRDVNALYDSRASSDMTIFELTS